jgi:hypothetical protein
MHKLATLLLAGILVLASGCRSSESDVEIFHAWGWENAKDAKAHLDQYEHVLVAEVYESHWEDLGPHRLTPYHFRGTVVRSYKGDWKVSEKIAFVHHVDAPAPTNARGAGSNELMFVFTNEHTKGEIGVDAGEFGTYDAEQARALDLLFPRHNTQ